MIVSMAEIPRRTALKCFVAAGAGVALRPSLAGADATTQPQSEWTQGAGGYRINIGDIEVTVLSDGFFPFGAPYPAFGADVGKAKVEAALRDAFLPTDRITFQINCLLIRAGNRVLLADTGCGSGFGLLAGRMVQNLKRSGVSPEDVTDVLITHLHPDHIGGAFKADGTPVFPRAAFSFHKADSDFWSQAAPDMSKTGIAPDQRSGMIDAAKKFLDRVKGKCTLLKGETTQVIPGVSAVLAAGHTPGHVTIVIESGEQRMIHIADLCHSHAIVYAHPQWRVAFDTDMQLGAATRQKYFAEYAQKRTLLCASHLPFPGLGHIRGAGEGYAWAPIDWAW